MSSLNSRKENALVLLGGGVMLFPQFIPALSRLKMSERSTPAADSSETLIWTEVDILFMLFFSQQSDLIEEALFLTRLLQDKRGCFISVALEQSS